MARVVGTIFIPSGKMRGGGGYAEFSFAWQAETLDLLGPSVQ